ncbi:sugar kinase [Flavobacterium sp. TAB 87]|uniref:sugar kinase n=1 Tax=Flavobacterium sp. TAB 87 TaxID=1729581 RepID=UPI00076D9507|nr:sugar kinase [Flavobacterium sp. TAB 87]KVV14987.1 2-dehydro-3-deoxygluconokinase [Flavobacterium sp. TAB 87]
MKKIVTFGEILLRLSTERHLRFSQADSFKATYGGGEFNVAVSLANYGMNTEYVTRIPDNEIGNCAIKEMRKLNVSHNNVLLEGDRMGIYFLETGTSTRASNIVYDRANSSMATLQKGMFDWKTILKDAYWFHWSGITPALSESTAEACLEAIEIAHEMGITISTDLNYRSKLWKYGKNPNEIMPKMLQYSTVILGDLTTANFMLGLPDVNPDYTNLDSLPQLYQALFVHCPNLKYAATTLRYSLSASHQRIGGILYDGKKLYNAEAQEVTPVVDRVGSGDAFMGGLIYGLNEKPLNEQRALNFAVAACCLKHTISGDYNLVTKEEIEKLIGGDFSGKVSR